MFAPAEIERLHGPCEVVEVLRDTNLIEANQTFPEGREALAQAQRLAPDRGCHDMLANIGELFRKHTEWSLTKDGLLHYVNTLGYPRFTEQLLEVMDSEPPTLYEDSVAV